MALSKKRRRKLCQRNRRPNHHQHQAHKPLKKVGFECLHQSQRHKQQENWYQKSRNAKALLNKKIGRIGTQRAAGILELTILVGHLARAQILDDAHVILTRREEGNERQHHAAGRCKEHHADEKPQTLILKYLRDARQPQRLKE